ncbi:MAG: EVE domain-containing protein [Proteobacteria bacterium]|nr:EVE domain-containing protein [Pseudomonadota bacterium]
MNHWLLKTEPTSFGIEDLAKAKAGTTTWDGVRNYQARNMLRDQIKRGDLAFFYHSSCKVPGITGVVEIVKAGYPDSTAFDRRDPHFDPDSDPANPTWYMVDVRLKRKFRHVITLTDLRTHAGSALRSLQLLKRGNRLSVMPVTKQEWDFILTLA